MKKLLLITILLASPIWSNASTHNNPLQPSQNVIATAAAKSNALATSSANVSGDYTNIKYDEEKPAASSSPAASSNTTAECRYLEQWAASIVIINGSSTKMLRDLVCTLEHELNPLQKLALCIEDGAYRELRYYISTLPPENGKPQESACPVGSTSRVMAN